MSKRGFARKFRVNLSVVLLTKQSQFRIITLELIGRRDSPYPTGSADVRSASGGGASGSLPPRTASYGHTCGAADCKQKAGMTSATGLSR